VLTGSAGAGYRTQTLLELRLDHATARDAIYDSLELERDLGRALLDEFQLFEIHTRARTRAEFLLNPELGRSVSDVDRQVLSDRCPRGADLQVAIGDGLSCTAIRKQVPELLPRLKVHADARGWRFGQPFLIRHCRVGVLNELGELLQPSVVVLLIGERPGLATSESLSAYFAYRPKLGDDDSCRNLISNIHARGIAPVDAATRIVDLASQLMKARASGVLVKEALGAEIERSTGSQRGIPSVPEKPERSPRA
jgi:ethanolamine ammonia-lyase small subunit